MKYLKVCELGNSFDFKGYRKFIYDKFNLDEIPYGEVEIVGFDNPTKSITIRIRIGGEIDPKFLKEIIEYFEEYKGEIYIQNDNIFYKIILPYNFLKELDIEIGSKKYNI